MKTILLALAASVAGCSGGATDAPAAVGETLPAGVIELAPSYRPLAFRRSGSGFVGGHHRFFAQIGESGAWSLKPIHPDWIPGPHPREAAALRIETRAVTRGGQAMAPGKARAVDEISIAVERGLATETLRNTASGIEQSWRFAQRPPVDPRATGGVSDLVVRVAVDGHDFVRATPDGIDFRDRDSGLGTRYGAATWVDRSGRSTPILPAYRDGVVTMTVPHELVERSTFPAILDPMVGTAFNVSNQPGFTSQAPDVVYSATGGVYGVVFETVKPGVADGVYVQIVTPTGTLVGGNVALAPTGTVEPRPAIGWDGNNFQVVWTDDLNRIKGQRVSTAGALVDATPLLIDTCAQQVFRPKLGGLGGGASLVVFNFTSTVNGQWATKAIRMQDGAASGGEILVQDAASAGQPLGEGYPAVASDGTQWVVAYSHGAGPGVSVRTVSATGAVGTAVDLTTAGIGYPNIVFNPDSTKFYVPWADLRDGVNYYLYGQTYGILKGATGPANGSLIYSDSSIGANTLSSTYDGGNYLSLFVNGTTGKINSQQVKPGPNLNNFGAPHTGGWLGGSSAPATASSGVGKSIVAFVGNITQSVRAQIYTSGIDGAPCTVDGDCDHGHCIANVPTGTGSSCCNTVCSASDSCHIAQCSSGTCTNFPQEQCNVSTCEVTAASCGSPTDSDGDQLADFWETSDSGPNSTPPDVPYIDYNCDGKWNPGEVLLNGATPGEPDVFVQYDWMDYGPPGNACSIPTDCTSLGSAHAGETCSSGYCVFSCAHGDSDCTGRTGHHELELCKSFTTPGGVLVGNVCQHTHDPSIDAPTALPAVVSAFAKRGYKLHLIRGSARPHSLVTSFRTDAQITVGCEGATGTSVGPGQYAVSIYDLKNTAGSAFPAAGYHAYHYGIFAHYSSCDTTAHCLGCPSATNPDGSTKASPAPGQSGIAEISGNDFIVSLGNRFQDVGFGVTAVDSNGIFNIGSTFMHELGHNLGLHHCGGVDIPCKSDADCTGVACTATSVGNYCLNVEAPEHNWKPNFLSVMNYRYQFTGVAKATKLGGTVGTTARLDYSTSVLPVAGNTPGTLNQSNVAGIPPGNPGLGLSEPAGLGSGTKDIFTFTDAATDIPPTTGATNGAVDWDGDGAYTSASVEADLNCPIDHACPYPPYADQPLPELAGKQDWTLSWTNLTSTQMTYGFQCTPYFGDGAGPPQGMSGGELSPALAAAFHLNDPLIPARIDVRPGCTNNWINVSSASTVMITTFGNAMLDVTQVDPTTTRFGRHGSVGNAVGDFDGDGYLDLNQQFTMSTLAFADNITQATLYGFTLLGQYYSGNDTVIITHANQGCTACAGWDGDGTPGCWYVGAPGANCGSVCMAHGGFNVAASTHTGNPICKLVYPEKDDGDVLVAEECCSIDNNTDWSATGAMPDPNYSNPACHLACACNN